MTIEQYSFRPPVPVTSRTPESYQVLLRTLVLNNQQRKKILTQGLYELTPQGTYNAEENPRFLLDVRNDGTGILTMLGINNDISYRLPASYDFMGVLTKGSGHQIEIHEVLAYVPDTTPQALTPSRALTDA